MPHLPPDDELEKDSNEVPAEDCTVFSEKNDEIRVSIDDYCLDDIPAEKTAKKQRGRPFLKGQSGNVTGRRPGSRNKATLIAEQLLEGQAEMLTRQMVNHAEAGDIRAARYCLDRIIPVRRVEKTSFQFPVFQTAADVPEAIAAVTIGLAEGALSPELGQILLKSIDDFRKSFIVSDLQKRVAELEFHSDLNRGLMAYHRD